MENFRLRVFRTVARLLNFRMAAESLFLTQPAVSQQVKALEAEAGCALFMRSAGRVQLTAAGKVLLPFAEQLAALAADAHRAVQQTAGVEAGSLVVGASQTIGQYLLPQLIAGFLAQYAKVRIEVRSGNTRATVQALIDGTVDVALIEGPAMRPEVHTEPFADDKLLLVTAAADAWADERILPEALREATLLLREHGSGSRRVAERALEAVGLPLRTLRLGMVFDSTEALMSAVEAGLGVAFVSQWAVRQRLSLRTLRPVHVEGLDLCRNFLIATHSGPEPTGAAGLFRAYLLAR